MWKERLRRGRLKRKERVKEREKKMYDPAYLRSLSIPELRFFWLIARYPDLVERALKEKIAELKKKV